MKEIRFHNWMTGSMYETEISPLVDLKSDNSKGFTSGNQSLTNKIDFISGRLESELEERFDLWLITG